MSEENQDQQDTLENCGEVVSQPAVGCEENPNQPGCAGPGASPPVPSDTSEAFLAPYDTIRVGPSELISATRELNVFNKKLFYDGTRLLDTESIDIIRFVTKKLWTWNQIEEKFIGSDPKAKASVSHERFITDGAEGKYWKGNLNLDFLHSGAAALPGYLAVTQYLADLRSTNVESVDTVFSAPQPFFEDEMDNVIFASSNTVSINSEVGYYEEAPEVPETDLPSLYRSYYSMINESYEDCDFDDSIQKFTSDSVSVMKEANDSMKRSFNQYVEIKIGTQQTGKISDFADEFQMDKYFLELVSSPLTQPAEYAEVLDEAMVVPTEQGRTPREEEALPNDRFIASASENTSPDPFYQLINNIKDKEQEFFESFDHSQYPLKFEYFDNPEALRFTDTIRSQIFMNNVESQIISVNKVRSLEDIFNGRKSDSETIGYKVAKHNVTTTRMASGAETYEVSEDPIQTFYFMDSSKVLDIDFVDTQVNPGKSYVYRIHSINLVIGNSTLYGNPTESVVNSSPPSNLNAHMTLNYRCYPHIRIIEAPFFEKFVSVIERPPLAPQVSFIPLQGVDDQMQILLNSNFGESEHAPVAIFPQDQIIINKMIESQPPRSDGLLEYQTDSLPEKFQILRLENPPERIEDFSSTNFIKTLSTSGRSLMFVDDDFLPNKDYYYCFRAFDKVGISNPSDVYKVRTNSYLNGIYLDIKQYEMRPLRDTKFSLSIKRALKIEPSFNQRALNFPGVSDIDTPDFVTRAPEINSVKIGSEDDSVWGRKFKVRLTSKHSGRKIDINVSFNKEKSEIIPNSPALNADAAPRPCGSAELLLTMGSQGSNNQGDLPIVLNTDLLDLPSDVYRGLEVTGDLFPSLNIDINPDDLGFEANRLIQEARESLDQQTPSSPRIQGTDASATVTEQGSYILFENTTTPVPPTTRTTVTPTNMPSSNSSRPTYSRNGY